MTRNKAVKKLNKNGFTLTEMLVTLLITCILLAIGLVGVLQYSKSLKLTEMDNTAKEIFLAAQNHLTTADADGTLDKYRGASEDDGTLNHVSPAAGTLIKAKPSDVGNIMWPEPNDRYYYVVSGADSLSGSILKDMLPFGAIDEEVRTEGHYIIEYDIKTGTMYGVFYSKAGFTYDDVLALDAAGGRMNTKDGKAARKNFRKDIIGYYGGAMSKNLVGTDSKDLMMTVENKDRLRILLEDPNYYIKPTEDSSMAQTEITLYITGLTSSKTEKFPLKLEHSDSPLTAPKKAAGAEDWWNVTGLSADGNVMYEITLDDITKDGGHFADICPDLIPGEDIIIRAVCESKTAALKFKEVRDSTNSLFASVSGVVDELGQSVPDTAGIYYLRHLENLDPEVSKLPQLPITDKNLVHKAIQFKPLDYKASEVFGSGNYAIYSYRTLANTPAQSLASNSYYGIYNPRLTEYNGNARSISNVKITGTDCGIFRKIAQDQPMEIKNLSLNDFHVDASENGGALAGTVSNGAKVTVKQVNVTNKTGNVTGGANAGGLIGSVSSQTEIDTCLVSGSVSASGNAGGVVGYLGGGSKATGSACVGIVSGGTYNTAGFQVQGVKNTGGFVGETDGAVMLEDCAANIKVDGASGNAGGLVGALGDGSEVKNSYSGGFTENGQYSENNLNVSGSTAGGLIGLAKGGTAVTNCYSTCSTKGSSYAGGFVGDTNKGGTYSGCYATGLAAGNTRGAFAGNAGGTYNNCKYLFAINPTTVKAAGNGTCSAAETKYEEMPAASGYVETFKTDASLPVTYAFKPVNTAGLAVRDAEKAAGAHFGDWPKEKEVNAEAFGKCVFAYQEKYTDENGKEQVRWYVMTLIENGTNWEVGEYDTLEHAKGKEVKDNVQCSYGFLSTDSDFSPKEFNGNPIKDTVHETEKYPFPGPNNTTIYYYYYRIKTGTLPNGFIPNSTTGVIDVTPWKTENNSVMQFQYNPDFAAAIMVKGRTPLGTGQPYQVRTDEQIRKIGTLDYYRTCF